MRRFAAGILTALLMLSAALWAEDAIASFVDGDVQQGSGSTWKAVAIGDKVEPGNSVKLGGTGAYLELKFQGATLSLSQPGSYAVAGLVAKAKALKSGPVASVLRKYGAALGSGQSANAATVAGVRGAEQGKSSDSDWVSNDTDVYLAAARDYIASGDYVAALNQLQSAKDSVSTMNTEIEFYFAVAEDLRDDPRAAFEHLERATPSGTETWASDYLLLKAKLFLETFAPQAASDILQASQASLSGDSARAPLYYFLLALARHELGDAAGSHDAVERLKVIAADSELAKAAETMVAAR